MPEISTVAGMRILLCDSKSVWREYALVITARGCGGGFDDVVLASGETDLGNTCVRICSCGYVKGFREAEEMSLSNRS